MGIDKDEGGEAEALSAEETAFFESGGEKEIAAPEPEAQPEPEIDVDAAAKAAVEGQPRDEKGKFVPHQALHAEREEHKKTKAELQELQQFRARMEERLNWVERLGQPEPRQEDVPPDPDKDIFGALKYEREKREALERQIAEQANQSALAQQQKHAEQMVWTAWEQDAQSYAKENPDFGNAAKWLAEFRDKQLESLGHVNRQFADVRARNAQIESELAAIVVAAKQQGMSSAQAIYQIAQGYGYQPKPADPAKLELPEQLQKVAKAQDASRTIGAASGKAGGDEMTLEALNSMPDHEFQAWVEVPANARRFKQLMGG